MELRECIPLDRISFIYAMDYPTFKLHTKNCRNDHDRKIKFDIMKSFCKAHLKTRGEIKRIYSHTDKTPAGTGGRLYCGNSIQSIQKDFRGFLMDGTTTDIDMRNAHPVILQYICSLHNIHCPNLTYYNNNRDKTLEQFGNDGKTLFLCAVNNDRLNKKCKVEVFMDFDKECKAIQKKLYSLECYKYIIDSVPESRLYNFLGSAINRILCVYENDILDSVISVMNGRGIEICALMFDGLLIYGDHYVDGTLLTEVENVVNEKFVGLNMTFTYKSHSTPIIMPDNFDEVPLVEISQDRSFEAMVLEFEKTHCKIISLGVYIKEDIDALIPMSRSHLKTAYEHLTYDHLVEKDGVLSIIQKSFIHSWITNNDKIRHYSTIDCFPDGSLCPNDCFNTWRPYAMELITEWIDTPDAVKAFRKHILILSNHEQEVADYLEAWIAQMIQYPAVKSICPTLISLEGAGKGTLLTLLAKMIGESRYLETTKPSEHVFGQFNGKMASAHLVCLDELSKKEMLGCEGQFKGLTTNPFMHINDKNEKSYLLRSYHRFIITTNAEDPIGSKKDDRRNLIIRSSDELVGNIKYFDILLTYLDSKDAVKSCYEYFKTIPNMDKFKYIKMPKTAYQEDIKQSSISPIESWLCNLTERNYQSNLSLELSSKDCYEDFIEWKYTCGVVFDVSSIQFGLKLKRLNISGVGCSATRTNNNTKVFDMKLLGEYFKLDLTIVENESHSNKPHHLLIEAIGSECGLCG